MIVNEEEALARLNSPDNLSNKLLRKFIQEDEDAREKEEESQSNISIEKMYKNRIGPRQIPPLIQTLAVATGRLTTQQAAANAFGMSQENVNYLTHEGKNVNRDKVNSELKKVHDSALDAMMESINLIKPKLENVRKATDLSKIAADMGRVIEKTAPREAGNLGVKIVVFAPNMKVESDYEEVVG